MAAFYKNRNLEQNLWNWDSCFRLLIGSKKLNMAWDGDSLWGKNIFTQQGNQAKAMVYTVSVQVRAGSVCFYLIFLSDISPSCMLLLISKLQGDIPPVSAIIYISQKDELSKSSGLTWLILNKMSSALTSPSGRCLCCLLAPDKCSKAKFLSLLTRVLWRISICDREDLCKIYNVVFIGMLLSICIKLWRCMC